MESTPVRPSKAALVAIGICAVLLVAAGIGAYVAGVLGERKQFAAAPPGCATIEPYLHLLGPGHTLTEKGPAGCDLTPPGQQAAAISVVFGLETSPKAAGERLDGLVGRQELSDLGDEAYRWRENVMVRLSNLLIVVVVYPEPVSTPSQVLDFTGAVVAAVG